MIKGKRIILGVTGSIAAYKTATLVRLLVKEGAEVRVVMTSLAKEFITPLTLATLSKNPIMVEFFDPENGEWNSHVSLGEWADAYLIAPATANTIAKMANGIADNLLLTTYLSAKCPVFVAPAMDLDMYRHAATQRNIQTLRSYQNHIIEPTEGELASGLIGKGRMEEPEQIAQYMRNFFDKKKTLNGKRAIVTAGATIEPIDPVRFISNYSTGKMGYAIAEELATRGAEVTIISGNVSVATTNKSIKIIKATSADDMYRTATENFSDCDIAIMCAAVADYTPITQADKKIKKNNDEWSLELKKTTDIAAELGKIKNKQILVGFALETDNESANAQDKLNRKNFDFIVLNSLQDKGAGFGCDTNIIKIISKNGNPKTFPIKSKRDVAIDIIDEIEKLTTK